MNVAIIDYGSGNLRSAKKAFERALFELGGGEVNLTNDPQKLKNSSHIVLPGVGAFADCMAGLAALNGMIESLEEQVIQNGKPFLGICVGMQLMANIGREYKVTNGLGWIPGEVVAILPDDTALKIPHMGWNNVEVKPSYPLFDSVPNRSYFYFVHSYYVVPEDEATVATTTNYGIDFVSGIHHENIHAFQFHPEKSQQLGLAVLRNFSKLAS